MALILFRLYFDALIFTNVCYHIKSSLLLIDVRRQILLKNFQNLLNLAFTFWIKLADCVVWSPFSHYFLFFIVFENTPVDDLDGRSLAIGNWSTRLPNPAQGHSTTVMKLTVSRLFPRLNLSPWMRSSSLSSPWLAICSHPLCLDCFFTSFVQCLKTFKILKRSHQIWRDNLWKLIELILCQIALSFIKKESSWWGESKYSWNISLEPC